MNSERLQEIIAKFPQQRIAVVGDYFLDKYFDIDPALVETSVETGKDAHQVIAVRRSAGAAGTVVNNLAALGAGELSAVGATGDDGDGYDLRHCLEKLGCRCDRLLTSSEMMTPVYLKPRDIGDEGLTGEYERYDTKNRSPLPDRISDEILRQLRTITSSVDAVIIADQVTEKDCGIISASLLKALNELAAEARGVKFFADSRTKIRSFRNIIIKPNQFEAIEHANPNPSESIDEQRLSEAIAELRDLCSAPVFVTYGDRGIWVSDPQPRLVRGVIVTGEVDPTGAGDSAMAGIVLALTAGADYEEAALIGNLVASITIQQLATTGTASPQQLTERLEKWREQQ